MPTTSSPVPSGLEGTQHTNTRRTGDRRYCSKYTLLTFLPHNLFEQFCNLANLYFLLVGVFQIIPVFSTTNGNPTMYQPLAFIVFVSACRAAKEDWDKHKADRSRNGFKYHVLQGGQFVETESGDIRVGQVVKVMQNNMVPADMLFINSALPKGRQATRNTACAGCDGRVCDVETAVYALSIGC